jgi:dienelactone hydrolase
MKRSGRAVTRRSGVLLTALLAPFVTALVEVPPASALKQSGRVFPVGSENVTLVDQTRETPAWGEQPSVPSRTIETLVVYPARGKGGNARRDAAPARGGPFPVVVFLHGASTVAEDYRPALERWSSAGYVTVAPTAPFGGLGLQQSGAARNADIPNHPADVRFVLDELSDALNPAVARIANFNRVVVMGKSLGATTALTVAFDPCCTTSTIRAAVPIAGPESPVVNAENRMRMLIVHSDSDELVPYEAARTHFDIAPTPKFLLTLNGVTHAQTLSTDLTAPADAVVIATTTDFFDRYLKSDDGALRRMRRDGNEEGVAELESDK